MLPVTLAGTFRRPSRRQSGPGEETEQYFVSLRHEASERYLQIPTGVDGAREIVYAENNHHTPTPTTSALIADVLHQVGFQLLGVEIRSVEPVADLKGLDQGLPWEGYIFRAVLRLGNERETKEVQARASYAVGLARRVGCPISVSEEVMTILGRSVPLGSKERMNAVRQDMAREGASPSAVASGGKQTQMTRYLDRGLLLLVAVLCVALYAGGLWLAESWHLQSLVYGVMPIVTIYIFYVTLLHRLERTGRR